ncbi:hypothetical protein MPTP_0963 [Melissococcus plutonius ATCC 35311]|uniref:Uncharacterized protein n=2 Tax=Melissococcus plutonius TaxID=33970 RepID=F3YA94_MELPT|nr:hypothetical protein [Melissococcus plutonius]BAK21422.1 hypothetical protein MPTP_0963 [Melissococcus plutonius ATCC 35311]BAL62212.1 hypothetical protein MPD5_0981 [Melissococcus plutonius DAT561]BBC61091.1 hypothetical protein DAT561_0979 [Melissococcus plutonius]BBD15219.1 hypothetical protein DAT585_0875 [Melissococcus plutonius]
MSPAAYKVAYEGMSEEALRTYYNNENIWRSAAWICKI